MMLLEPAAYQFGPVPEDDHEFIDAAVMRI